MLPLDRFFHPVMPSAKLRRNPVSLDLGTRLSRERILLFRNQAGQVSAIADRCPHRGTPLSIGHVSGSSVVCPYHGWRVDGDGATAHPIKGPIRNCRVATYSVHESHGFIWVASRPDAVRATFPGNEWVHMGGFELEINAPLELVLDNFNEDEHFPYVHKVLGWDVNGAKDIQFEHQQTENSLEVMYRGLQREFFGKSLFLSPRGAHFNNRWTVQFDPVRISYTATTTDSQGVQISPLSQHVVVYFVPEGESRTVLRVVQHSTLGLKKWNSVVRVLAPIIVQLTKWDFGFDKRLLEDMVSLGMSADSPIRYGEHDQPLYHARKLLKQVYWRTEASTPRSNGVGADLVN